jgi:hypothetical protein
MLEYCNLSSSDGLLRFTCWNVSFRLVQLDVVNDAYREMRCDHRLSRELQRSSAGATAILLGYQKDVMDVELVAHYIESQTR